MGGEGHMLDMIRRLSEGREASRLRRERNNEKLKHLNRSNEHYPLPNTTSEEMRPPRAGSASTGTPPWP